jgi:dipeptidyl aminopeptidase/acylaminoacyl peptidase
MTPDGRHVFYYSIPNADSDQAGPVIWTQDLIAKTAPRALTSAQASNVGGLDVSPDGKWVAYHSRESGQLQVYVEAFPGPGPRIQVSVDSGGSPVWRADGRELFYARANEGAAAVGYRGSVGLVAVTVTMQPTLSFGTPRQLFAGQFVMNAPARGYDVTPDGQRFVFFQARERAAVVIRELSVVQNWVEELKRRLPSR